MEQREQRLKERSEEKKSSEDRSILIFIYVLYISMYEQTKKMPAASQHVVKRNIFPAVSQEEARLLYISVVMAHNISHFIRNRYNRQY